MFDSKLARLIEKILNNNPETHYKSGDIAREIKLKKHKRRDLEDTLRKLKKQQRISGRNKRYFANTSSPSKQYIGTLDARTLAKNLSFAFVVKEGKDVYVSREDILNAYHGDTVTVGIKYTGKDYIHGYIVNVNERARNEIVGVLDKIHGLFYIVPDSSLLHTDFQVDNAPAEALGKKVVGKILNWGDPSEHKLPICSVTEILGDAGDPDVEIMSVIRQNDLSLTFPESVLNELKYLPEEISDEEISKRSDLRNIFTLTIDPASAKDFDDAVSLEKNEKGYRLQVHIADVAHYVLPGTALFSEAAKRGNSFYFPRKVIPMLPEKISNQLCSLRPLEDKLTVSVITDFDVQGNIVRQYAIESIICSNVRLDYEQVDEFFEKENSNLSDETKDHLQLMRELSRLLQHNRLERGYLSLDLPETEYVFDDEGHVIDLRRSRETESHQVIENFMLTANEYIAKKLGGFHTMYRVHEAPSPERIEDMQRLSHAHKFNFQLKTTLNHAFQDAINSLETPERHRVFDRVILRHMSKARYDTSNLGHFGLALQDYTHFTSPIRRLCDLIVHHQIKKLINDSSIKDKLVFSETKLKEFSNKATERELLADSSEREVDQKNKLLFMKKHLGEKFEGVITTIKSNKVIVELDRYPVTGVVPLSTINDDYYEYHEYNELLLGVRTSKTIRLADKVEVLIAKVDDDIILQLLKRY